MREVTESQGEKKREKERNTKREKNIYIYICSCLTDDIVYGRVGRENNIFGPAEIWDLFSFSDQSLALKESCQRSARKNKSIPQIRE